MLPRRETPIIAGESIPIRIGRRKVQRLTLFALGAFLIFADSFVQRIFADIDNNTPPTLSNVIEPTFNKAARAVVKLYGAKSGREHGYGTGFLISADGKIITSLSVLMNSRTLRVELNDGRKYDAEVVRRDEYRQLALLKIDAPNLSYIEPQKSDQLQVGDPIIVLGNWFKIAQGEEPVSVSKGILSLRTNLNARRLAHEIDYQGPALIYDVITANPGAAGGPALDLDGNCIGIIGRVVESAETNTRINYAIPGEEIIAFLNDQSSTKPARDTPPANADKAYIGIKISQLGYREVAAYVERVRAGSPAAQAGIRADDLIVAIGGRRISNVEDYDEQMGRIAPGDAVQFTVKRGTQLINVEVKVGTKP